MIYNLPPILEKSNYSDNQKIMYHLSKEENCFVNIIETWKSKLKNYKKNF